MTSITQHLLDLSRSIVTGDEYGQSDIAIIDFGGRDHDHMWQTLYIYCKMPLDA